MSKYELIMLVVPEEDAEKIKLTDGCMHTHLRDTALADLSHDDAMKVLCIASVEMLELLKTIWEMEKKAAAVQYWNAEVQYWNGEPESYWTGSK